jgi:hypothetical protein
MKQKQRLRKIKNKRLLQKKQRKDNEKQLPRE